MSKLFPGSGRSAVYFLYVFRGLPTNILQMAATQATRGVDFRGCSKKIMAEEYASQHCQLPAPCRIGDRVMRMFLEDRISKRQRQKVREWLVRGKYIHAEDHPQ